MSDFHPETASLHAGEDEPAIGGPVASSIVASTTFYTSPGAVGFSATDLSETAPWFYSRWSNPSVARLEAKLAALEGGAGAVCFASGMAAVSALFFSRLKAGDHLILSNVCYAGVAELAHQSLSRLGIEVSSVNSSDAEAVRRAARPGVTRLIHIETPANPTLTLSDIEAIAKIAHEMGAELSVDSTIATPIATRPLMLHADFVVHSLTKYICGHGDALGGAVIAADPGQLAELRRGPLIHQGGALNPFAAWLICRGLETLPLRMSRHEENARKVAEFLQAHPRVRAVWWPGLDSHPQADLAKRQMQNYSGLLSFSVQSGAAALAQTVAETVKVFSYAVSLGKTKSLIFYVPTDDILRTSYQMSPQDADDYRRLTGEGVFRVSVGLEHADDLIADLSRALA